MFLFGDKEIAQIGYVWDYLVPPLVIILYTVIHFVPSLQNQFFH